MKEKKTVKRIFTVLGLFLAVTVIVGGLAFLIARRRVLDFVFEKENEVREVVEVDVKGANLLTEDIFKEEKASNDDNVIENSSNNNDIDSTKDTVNKNSSNNNEISDASLYSSELCKAIWNDEDEEIFDENGVCVKEVSGQSFQAHVMIVKDPSKVFVGTIYPWRAEGVTLDELVSMNDAIGGINGGLYSNFSNTGGSPMGVVVENGKITYNIPSYNGLYLIGFDEENTLVVDNISGLGSNGVAEYVENNKIRDAVTFLQESGDPNCHFVNLVKDGEPCDMEGLGVGLNPRTAIGQRADGSVILVTADGRGACSHLGANAEQLQELMIELGAVTAANLDGGSSSAMYYDGEYEMTSVTFYYRDSSWKLPTGFMVK